MTSVSTIAVAPREAREDARPAARALALAAVSGVAVTLTLLVSLSPMLAVLGVVGGALGLAVVARPALGAYLLFGATPLIAGIDRGRLLPVIRPSEALLVLVGSAVAFRAVVLPLGPRGPRRLDVVAGSIAFMAVANSAVVIGWMAVRGRQVSSEDLMYALVLWKCLGLYVIVRTTVRSEVVLRRCLWAALAAGAVVAIVAILQSLQVLGLARLLATYYTPEGGLRSLSNGRGSSLLALPIATGDLMVFDLVIAAGLWLRRQGSALVLAGLSALFLIGAVASGQFSAVIGIVIAVGAAAAVSRRWELPSFAGLAAIPAGVLMRPVIERRLEGFETVSGRPESWSGRLSNLRNFFWPELFADGNFLLGVRPLARLPGRRSIGIDWVWIESGYTWLLWGGGLPLLAGFVVFSIAAARRTWRLARTGSAAPAAVGIAGFASVVVMVVLMAFDTHLTYRGSADLFFALLALAAIPWPAKEAVA